MRNRHFTLSIVKSAIRMLGAIVATFAVINGNIKEAVLILALISVFAAEVLGIVEEIFDTRK